MEERSGGVGGAITIDKDGKAQEEVITGMKYSRKVLITTTN